MYRKDFIKACCAVGISGSVLSTFLQGCSSTNYFAQSTLANNQIIIKKNQFEYTLNGKIKQRKYILIKTEKLNFPIYIYKTNEDEYSVLLMQCSHKGCELNPNGIYLVCPCHGSEFSNTGKVISPPAETNLTSFKSTTDNENIYIHL